MINNVYMPSIVLHFSPSTMSDVSQYNKTHDNKIAEPEDAFLTTEQKEQQMLIAYNKACIKELVLTIINSKDLASVINMKESRILFIINDISFVVTNMNVDTIPDIM